MVGFNVMVELYVFGSFIIVLLVCMIFIDDEYAKSGVALGLMLLGAILLASQWYYGKEARSTEICVATVTAHENWENMSIADLHSAAQEAVEAQPVSPSVPEQVVNQCSAELQAQAQPDPATSEN